MVFGFRHQKCDYIFVLTKTQRVLNGRTVWLQIGPNDIMLLSDRVNTGWKWPSTRPSAHTNTQKNRCMTNIPTINPLSHPLDPSNPSVFACAAPISTVMTPCFLLFTVIPPESHRDFLCFGGLVDNITHKWIKLLDQIRKYVFEEEWWWHFTDWCNFNSKLVSWLMRRRCKN